MKFCNIFFSKNRMWLHIRLLSVLLYPACSAVAQNEQDALMMKQKEFCTGFMFQSGQWDHYWEGTLKRDNPNIGRFQHRMVAYMGMYGITNRINVFAALPWVKTSSTGGQWKGQQGLQDIQVWLKFKAFEKKGIKDRITLLALAGLSTPVNNYSVDMLPYSLGLGSTQISSRIMADYQRGRWFATGSFTYVWRSNVTLDRTAYFTNAMHYSREVYMPNATQWMIRAGYRYKRWVAEYITDNWTTQGGHDITRNNMPFISNQMNQTRMGIQTKWEDGIVQNLSVIAGGNHAIAGRNTGQATQVYGGIVYLFKPSKTADKK